MPPIPQRKPAPAKAPPTNYRPTFRVGSYVTFADSGKPWKIIGIERERLRLRDEAGSITAASLHELRNYHGTQSW